MYNLVAVKDTIRIHPSLFSESLEKSVLAALREQYEGRIDSDLGVIVSVSNPTEMSDGKIILGDGAAYHDVVFEALTFKPEIHEVIRGTVSEITEFGAFVKFGPIDGLVHASQVTDDFMSYNEKMGGLLGRSSKKVLKKDDLVIARVIAVSMKNSVAESKINLTMRQEGLGMEKWLVKKKKPAEKKEGGKKDEPKKAKKEKK
ncbi:MAG: DNA-directed RNA polymerase [Candidatus Micrarchaeota archaeon]